jgi:hypothetical protein
MFEKKTIRMFPRRSKEKMNEVVNNKGHHSHRNRS